MKLKEYIVSCVLTVILFLPVQGFSQNPYDKIGCCGLAILVPVYIITSWIDGIENLIDDIDDSRTVNAGVKGVKGSFQRNTVVYNKNRKGGMLKGTLVKKIEVTIRGKEMRILPGEILFHENGNIAKCLISRSELYAGNNTVVNCTDSVEFYDDEFVKSTILQDDSDAESGLFTIQGKKRKLTGGISFYNNGIVEECRLKNESVFAIADYTVSIPGETTLMFYENGNLFYIKPVYKKSVSLKYKNEFLTLSSGITLHENGKIKHCELNESIVIQNGSNKLRVKGRISFYDNEMIDECRIINPVSINVNNNIIEFDKSDSGTLSFYKNGNVKEGRITKNKKQYYIHDGNRFSLGNGTPVKFYENGSLMSLIPLKDTILNVGNERFLLHNSPVRFNREGGVLSLHTTLGSEFVYQGRKLYVNNYSEKLFFNRSQELIIFNNDKGNYLQINGKSVFVPPYVKVSYADFDKKIVDYLGLDYKNITLPPDIKITDIDTLENTDIFVKAGNFFTDKNLKNIYANDIRDIMFSEDTMITVNGKDIHCEAMTWFKVSDDK
jgi:hypothetical protein